MLWMNPAAGGRRSPSSLSSATSREQRGSPGLNAGLAVGRMVLIAAAMVAFDGALTNGAPAQSNQQIGQWCAYFTGGPTNCNFATFDDCLNAIKGKTALCVQNADGRAPGPNSSTTRTQTQHHSGQQ
jgi:hypothetical protein